MPLPNPNETESEYIARYISSEEAKKSFPDEKQRLAVAYSEWKKHKNPSGKKEHICLQGLSVKEEPNGDIHIKGLAATTHPDRVGDILSEKVIQQIVDNVNNTTTAGGDTGAYRSVSLFHDWIVDKDPTKDEVAFTQPTAQKIRLPDGHYAAEIDTVLNKFYRGDMTLDEVQYRIKNKQIAGFSIEYDADEDHIKHVDYNGKNYRFIDELSEFGGIGLARARKIANPHAVIYKEIEDIAMVDKENPKGKENMEEQNMADNVNDTAAAEALRLKEAQELAAKEQEVQKIKEAKEKELAEIELKIKEQVMKELEVKSKIAKQTKEEATKMDNKELPLSIKEMKESISIGKMDTLRFKEAASTYFAEHPEIESQLTGAGIPLHTTMKVKCVGNKLQIVGGLQIKGGTLDSSTNAGAYTESSVEFADLFIPGLIETYNTQTNLFGAMRKVNHVMGGNMYGWRIKTNQATTLSVDPDDPTVIFSPVGKLKLHTEIKEYRVGVSVTDYVLHHGRATMGDILMVEAEARMRDLLKDINNDLFTEQVDTAGNKILGLEAVADSAGNTSMYGKTRSTANRLAPDAAADTYVAVGGALSTSVLRNGAMKVETEGAQRQNLRIVTCPKQRDALFELEDGNQNYFTAARLGFEGQISYDGIPMIVDSSCQEDSLYIVDFESYYIVMSKAPQMVGLAKVGAAESAYISTYFAVVYEQPRRIHMLNTLT